jgi:hypothetical protein
MKLSLAKKHLLIILDDLRPRPLGQKERHATSEATLLYRVLIREGMQIPSQSLALSQRDVSLLLLHLKNHKNKNVYKKIYFFNKFLVIFYFLDSCSCRDVDGF